ncbi:MAG: BLUF domain-containing protein [Methylocystis sp.]
MLQLIYFSTAQLGLSVQELEKILVSAVANNQRKGVTGLLLFNGLNFLQILEGAPAEVDDLYDKISADPRHSGVRLIRRQEIKALSYPQWGMKLKEIGADFGAQDPLSLGQEAANALMNCSSEELKPMLKAFLTLN